MARWERLINVAEAGGSTGGRLGDIHALARCFANRRVFPGVRLKSCQPRATSICTAAREGLFETLHIRGLEHLPAGRRLGDQAFNMGALAEDEVMISTQARNFPGRNGHPKARHFLGVRTHRGGVGVDRQDRRSHALWRPHEARPSRNNR